MKLIYFCEWVFKNGLPRVGVTKGLILLAAYSITSVFGVVATAQEKDPVIGVVIVNGLRNSNRITTPPISDKQMPSYLQATQSITADDKDNITLEKNASVRRADSVLKAGFIRYNKGTSVMNAQGNARLIRDGNIVVGPSLTYTTDKETGQVQQPNFWLESGGAGVGSKAEITSRSTMTVHDMTYSGCPCPAPAWYIESKKLDLDFDANEGVARNAVLYFKDFPILASPYLTFPLKKERKSGFLIPTFASTSQTGFDFTLPYYINIAPDYDATVQTRSMSKRGVQLGGEFRYLGESYAGTYGGTYLSNDTQTGTDRWLYSVQHAQSFGKGFYGSLNLNGVSDDNYFKDFSILAVNQASTTYLPKTGVVGWADKYWQSSVTVATYQTLQTESAPIRPQYNLLPSVALNGARYNVKGFDVVTQNAATSFEMPLTRNGQRQGQDGQRYSSYTSVAMPIVQPGWYITPKVGVNVTRYDTNWYQATGLGGRVPTNERVLPIMSLDAGMTFERSASFFGSNSIQTLEPRIYYLNVPYRDQSNLPVYDTTLADFSFSRAFQENIYTGGGDRIANANQVTLALGSRMLDEETGFERMSVAVGQQIYFEDQKVTLPGEVPRTNVKSEFLIGASAALTNTLTTGLSLQYNPYDQMWDRTQVGLRWNPKRAASISASYRYQRQPTGLYQPQDQEQVSVSFQWPLTKKVYAVGRVDYSLLSNPNLQVVPRVTQAIAGIEYKGDCCWTARVVYQSYAIDPTQANNAIFFQLELSGLGQLGQNAMGLLGSSIPNFENITNPVPSVGKYQRYE